ncbi:putative Ig domain-containing protein, partial [Yaniella sp.]|uniref:putative Ig domain-containing protein n=1 Tax=Yaniella sp. TaxID=2773929 RepID=UPI002649D526
EPAEQDTPESETAPEQDQPQHDLVIDQQADVAVPVGEELEPVTLAVNDEEAYVEFSGLPAGLIAVPDERSITGTPQDVGEHEILVTATDRHGRQQQMSFVITVEEHVEDEPSGQLGPEQESEQEPQATTATGEDLEPVSQISTETAESTARNYDTVEVASPPDDETQSSSIGTGLADTGTGTTVVFVAGALVLVGLGTCALLLHRRRRQS